MEGQVRFRWNAWNVEHIAAHGVDPDEAEFVVARAKQPFPLRYPEQKWFVWGQGKGGRLLQVIYILDDDGTAYVIHARSLTRSERRRYRRRKR
jgi:uncharacterized DUF497 family protein